MGNRDTKAKQPATELFYYSEAEGVYKPLVLDDGKLGTKLTQSDIQMPIEIQSRLTQTIQAHNAVALTVSGGATPNANSGAYIKTDGFDFISVITRASASHSGRFQIEWSIDGVTTHAYELPSATNSNQYRVAGVSVKAPYARVFYENSDATIAPTVSSWVHLRG
jgi:hypothetical protein